MSRVPKGRSPYGYTVVPPNYYFDDTEGYGADYSESDVYSDAPAQTSPPPLLQAQPHTHHMVSQPPDVTEIYRRKTIPVTNERYQTQSPLQPQPHSTQQVYVSPEYYYDHVSQAQVPQQIRRTCVASQLHQVPLVQTAPLQPPRPVAVCRYSMPMVDELGRYYTTVDHHYVESSPYNNMVFRSNPQLSAVQQAPQKVPSANLVRNSLAVVRKPPVTVRTPRYYRKPNGNSLLYKRPSALCLPLASQPDPAVYRRPKKSTVHIRNQEQNYKHQDASYRAATPRDLDGRHSAAATKHKEKTHQESSGGDVLTHSDLDAMLTKYEKIFEEAASEKSINTKPGDKRTDISSLNNMHMLKPKVPASMKLKQEKTEKNKNGKNSKDSIKEKKDDENNKTERVEVEEITTEVLDNLLSELMSNGCKNCLEKAEKKQESASKRDQPQPANNAKDSGDCKRNNKTDKDSYDELSKSFNYEDVARNITKSCSIKSEQINHRTTYCNNPRHTKICQQNYYKPEINEKNSQNRMVLTASSQTSPKSQSRATSPTCGHNVKMMSSSGKRNNCPRALDDTNALELHRSKSYIVDLIDRALSKELGTVPEKKRPQKESVTYLDAQSVIELVNKHVSRHKMDKELCFEITQALTQSLKQSTPQTTNYIETRSDIGNSPYVGSGDEPLYVKHLKQLRWGHLKHIQREVRRLEDLERFLDSCTNSG